MTVTGHSLGDPLNKKKKKACHIKKTSDKLSIDIVCLNVIIPSLMYTVTAAARPRQATWQHCHLPDGTDASVFGSCYELLLAAQTLYPGRVFRAFFLPLSLHFLLLSTALL